MKININVINRAIKEAKLSDVWRGKVGAVLFTNDCNIVLSSHNVTIDGNEKYTIHAEENIIFKAMKQKLFDRLPNEKIYLLVLRWRKKDDTIAMSKPCERCQYWINKYKLKVYYSDDNGNIVKGF